MKKLLAVFMTALVAGSVQANDNAYKLSQEARFSEEVCNYRGIRIEKNDGSILFKGENRSNETPVEFTVFSNSPDGTAGISIYGKGVSAGLVGHEPTFALNTGPFDKKITAVLNHGSKNELLVKIDAYKQYVAEGEQSVEAILEIQ